jgi:2'-hydroxyisoflavone reductase
MRILILGGTIFLGRHIIDAAQTHGHEVTIFHRGEHASHTSSIQELYGNRNDNLRSLENGTWDVVIDTSGYIPRLVRNTAELLRQRIGRYVFISSLSVYPDDIPPNIDESYLVSRLEDTQIEEITSDTYGPLKAMCEDVITKMYGNQSLIIRPGLIVGPYDPTDRFTYWPRRITRGGEVLAPERSSIPVQFIDVRDLSKWIISMIEKDGSGVYNATGPDHDLTLGEIFTTAKSFSGSNARFIWTNERFLRDQGVSPWSDLPLWLPEEQFPGFNRINCQKAISVGLTYSPLVETIHSTMEWDTTRPAGTTYKAGLGPQRESEILAAWHLQSQR